MTTMRKTKEGVAAAVQIVAAVAETIREVGEIPSGHLYAQLMAKGCTLPQYEQVLGILKRAKLVDEDKQHVLRWVGPAIGKGGA